jgi:hypothetical protein
MAGECICVNRSINTVNSSFRPDTGVAFRDGLALRQFALAFGEYLEYTITNAGAAGVQRCQPNYGTRALNCGLIRRVSAREELPVPSESALSAETLAQPATRAARQGRFFLTMSALMLCIVLVGFAPTFYLQAFFDERPLRLLLHIHGAVLTAWFVWLLVQTSLVAARRVDIHRRFGVTGVALGLSILVISPFVTLGAVNRLSAAYGWDSALPFTVVALSGSPINTVNEFVATVAWGNFAYLVAFAVLLTGAVIYRRRPDVHKRLISLASVAIIGPALTRISRWPVFGEFEDFRFGFAGLALLIGALVVYDYLHTERVHRATLWGGGICLIVVAGARIFAGTELGQALVRAIAA